MSCNLISSKKEKAYFLGGVFFRTAAIRAMPSVSETWPQFDSEIDDKSGSDLQIKAHYYYFFFLNFIFSNPRQKLRFIAEKISLFFQTNNDKMNKLDFTNRFL